MGSTAPPTIPNTTRPKDVTIIGAGLAGCSLALALSQHSIPVRIYESRLPTDLPPPEQQSGVILTPNGLRVLDWLGVFDRIRHRCWLSEYRTYKNDLDQTTRKSLIANEELYGYKNHRLWRGVLLDELKGMLEERGVEVVYGGRFGGVVRAAESTTSGRGNGGGGDGDAMSRGGLGQGLNGHSSNSNSNSSDSTGDDVVTFLINNTPQTTHMLIGADGIYSSVRKHVSSIVPEYTGTIGVLSHINRNTISWPYEDFEKACTIQGKPGAMFMIPEVPDGSEIMVGKQTSWPDMTRKEWEVLAGDKDKMCEFYRQGYEEWGETAKKVIDAVCASKETLYCWPFLRMPKLERWFAPGSGGGDDDDEKSDGGRSGNGIVVIVGDAAHAIPPSSGQGVNQALEDVYTLTMLLTQSQKGIKETLQFWQSMRQARIDAVFDWATNSTNVQRLPEAERLKLIKEGKAKDPNATDSFDDMRWLYQPHLDEIIQTWLKGKN